MKKHLGWVIRMLIAALGIGYIVYTLNWSDKVTLPPGYVSVEGRQLSYDQSETYFVVEQSKDSYFIRHTNAPFSGRYDEGTIAKSQIGTSDDQPQFKPSFITILKQADQALLIGGGLIMVPVVLLASLRWWVLMRARRIAIAYTRVVRLTLAGYFFNLCMPGTTGGDVMKAYYAAKGTRQRPDAVVSIGIDRLCGLIGLIILVALIGLLSLDDPLIRRITIAMWLGLAGLITTAWLYTSPTLRSRLRLEARFGSLPGAKVVRKVDAWVSAYRRHLGALSGAIGLSILIHTCLATTMTLAGFAMGVQQPAVFLIGMIPIVLVLWSLPVSGPLGLGPLDYVAVHLIIGSSPTTDQQALMMFVAFRLYLVGVGLVGAIALLGLGGRPASGAESSEREAEAGP
ncbi:MAG: lysylphosphatidylglycerol synthase transmembrane domain-containing protein [Planctomycetota bacterium]